MNIDVQEREVRAKEKSLMWRVGEKGGGRGEKKRICPGTPENDSVGIKIIYGSHLRGCSVTVRPRLI